ncbi:unnamed protein product, partial [Rotaria magnacalcarata]
HSIDWDRRKTKWNIQYQTTLVKKKLQRTEYNMLKHLCQLSSKFDLKSNIHVKHSIDIVFQAFAIILRNDLNPFHIHFAQKKLLLHFNFHGACLVKSFYDLNPTEKQIHLVQQIWRTKLNSCERLLREKTKRTFQDSTTIVNMNLLSVDDFVPVMLAIIEARLVTTEQRTQNETLQNFDKMSSDLPWNIKETIKVEEKLDEVEQQNLSEKMSQLSTNATHKKDPIKIMKEIRDQLEIIPNYLTKQNISFKKLMHQVLSSIITAATAEKSNNNNNNMDELRKLAILLYKIMVIQTYQYLWRNYFKSANHFQGYTLSIQKMLLAYIEQNLNSSLSKKIEHQVELIHYDYHIRTLKSEYFQHKPNEYQRQLMKQICQSKYEQETSEREYEFLKQQITYYNLPSQSFECSTISRYPLVDSIQNLTVQEALKKQFKEVA